VTLEPPSDQQPAEVTLRLRRRSFDEVWTVYLRDEDGNRLVSSTGTDLTTARAAVNWYIDQLRDSIERS